jgi:hypothetical protein
MKGFFILPNRPRALEPRRFRVCQGERNVQRSKSKSRTSTRTSTVGNRSPTRRCSVMPGFAAPKWAKDFSLGRSPRNLRRRSAGTKGNRVLMKGSLDSRKRKLQLLPPGCKRKLQLLPPGMRTVPVLTEQRLEPSLTLRNVQGPRMRTSSRTIGRM